MGLSEALALMGLIALVGFVILSIFLVIAIYNAIIFMKDANKNIAMLSTTLSDSVREVRKDITDMKDKVIETMIEVDKLTTQANSLTRKIETETDSLVKTIQPYQSLLKNTYYKIAPPLITTTNLMTGIIKFVSVVSEKLFKKK